MEHDGDSQPPQFWFPPPTNLRRRPAPSRLINPMALMLALPILALLIFYLLVPPHANQILRPNSVKRSWDSLNVVLVLFAVLCGVFARRNDDPPPAENVSLAASGLDDSRPRHSVPPWLDFPDRKEYNTVTGDASSSGGGMRRSSSSYPDLRQESIWESGGGNRARFFDDFEVDIHRSPSPPEDFHRLPRPRRRDYEAEREEIVTLSGEIPVDKFEVRSAGQPPQSPKSSTPPPAPPPPPPAATLKRRRSVRSVPLRKNTGRRRDEAETNIISENRRPVQPAAPPPPQPELQSPVEETSGTVRRRKSRGGATKGIATAIASLYKDQRKRKKRGIKIRNVYESSGQNSDQNPQSAPPPPPPPPQSMLLQNLFKKSGKSKRVHSVPTTSPPPPPPPPPNSIFVNLSNRFQPSSSTVPPPPPPPPASLILSSLFKKGSINSRRFINAITSPPPPPLPPRRLQLSTGKPPKPFKQAPTTREEDTKVFVAPPSPLIPLPPPPPPPQLRMAKARFVARGDFVRIRSAHSSRCSSPELEDVDIDVYVDVPAKPDVRPPISCPSPDVNVKADTFIARLRDEWRLEKVNSVKEKRQSG